MEKLNRLNPLVSLGNSPLPFTSSPRTVLPFTIHLSLRLTFPSHLRLHFCQRRGLPVHPTSSCCVLLMAISTKAAQIFSSFLPAVLFWLLSMLPSTYNPLSVILLGLCSSFSCSLIRLILQRRGENKKEMGPEGKRSFFASSRPFFSTPFHYEQPQKPGEDVNETAVQE